MSKWRTKGGSFIGVVESITFESKTWESDNAKSGEYRTLTAKLMVKKDGADEAIEQYLPAGFLYDNDSVSKNGKVLNKGEVSPIDPDSDFARFVDTLEEAGFDSKPLDENNYTDFSSIEGLRLAFKQEINKERQIASGLKKLGAKRGTKQNEDGTFTIKGKQVSEADVMEAGKRIGKGERKGQKFNQTRLVVSQILDGAGASSSDEGDEEEEEAPAPKKGAKGGKKTAPPAEEEDEADEDGGDEDEGPSNKEAIKFFLALLKEEDDAVGVTDIPVLVARRIKNKGERDAMTAKLTSTEFLAEENGWSVKGSGKKASVSID